MVTVKTGKPSQPIIVCRDVVAGYGQETVLHKVNLEITAGDYLPFIGPNGAGKTTLLRIILGLLRPRSGQVITPPGYVPQIKNIDPLYPVTLFQIVSMGLYPKLGWSQRMSREDREFVYKTLDEFDLLEHASKRYAELSGGMRQKAVVARAFVTGADVFVMDEPTSELDENSEKEVFSHLFRLSREKAKTVLFAIHSLEHIAETAESICAVNHGCVTLMPKSEFMARRKALLRSQEQ
jgi:ABC-type Mn2+/Zn2+ transport system ATPase subunit